MTNSSPPSSIRPAQLSVPEVRLTPPGSPASPPSDASQAQMRPVTPGVIARPGTGPLSPARLRVGLGRERTSSGGSIRSEWSGALSLSSRFSRQRIASWESTGSLASRTTMASSEYWAEKTSLVHFTTVELTRFPEPGTARPPQRDAYDIARFMDDWGIQAHLPEEERAMVLYNEQLSGHGVTRPDDDPEIGPAAFSDVLHTRTGPIDLDTDAIALQVALTSAHEVTHLNQLDELPRVDMSKADNAWLLANRDVLGACYAADNNQKNLFEAIAYHGEIRNISRYMEAHRDALEHAHATHPKDSMRLSLLDQLRQMRDISATKLDAHFGQLPLYLAEAMNDGDLERVLLSNLEQVPDELVLNRKSMA